MTLSLCMIVKNEEKVLARCLDSVTGCFDEIIVLDTGSTDRTCEIAKRYTDKIYHTIWEDDFAKARNDAFQKATCDYIMWLDADDILTEPYANKLKELKKQMTGDIDIYDMTYATAFDEEDNPTFYFTRERIVKRTAPHRWIGCVHEILECNGTRKYIDIFIYHKSIKTTYSDRNLKIFENKFKADGYLPPREQFYYARELYYHKRISEAKNILTALLISELGWVENRIDAYIFLSKCYESEGNITVALRCLLCSFLEAPPRSQTACEIGRLLMAQNKYQDAIWWYTLALDRCASPSAGAFIDRDYHEYIPCLQLCVCYDRISDIKLAKKYHERARKVKPYSTAVIYNQAYFETLEQDGCN